MRWNECIELTAWVTKNEPRNFSGDADDMRNHTSLCVGMIHVLGERNKRKLMCDLCFERDVVSLFMENKFILLYCMSQEDF